MHDNITNRLQKVHKHEGGISIIEILIVLAVIGLILAVIIGVAPQLFKQAANSARETDVRLLQTTINNTIARNNGAYPTFTEFQGIVGGMEWAHYNGQGTAPAARNLATGAGTPTGTGAIAQVSTGATITFGNEIAGYVNFNDLGTATANRNPVSVNLPGRDIIHVWAGYACDLDGSTLRGGNDKDITEATDTKYAADTTAGLTGNDGTVTYTGLPAGAISIVYQLEGEATARCVDNQ